MSEDSNLAPKIVAERDGYRLVLKQRDPKSWKNTSDLTLESKTTDAMREAHWIYVYNWTLGPQSNRNKLDPHDAALSLLLTEWPVMKDEPSRF